MSRPTEFKGRLWLRLLLSSLIPTALIVLSLGWLSHNAAAQSMERQLGESLCAVARSAALHVGKPRALQLHPGDEESRTYDNLREKLAQLRQAAGVRSIVLFDLEERAIVDDAGAWRIGERLVRLAADQSELTRVRQGQSAASLLFEGADGRWYKSGFAPVRVDGKIQAIVAADGSASFFGPLEQLQRILLLLGAAALLLVGAVSWLVAKRITRPIHHLAEEAHRIGRGQFDAEIQAGTSDEIGMLAHTLNEMRANILKRDQHLQMMLAGIAHEVRNPLGGMSLFVGLLKEELADKPEASKHLKRVATEVDYLGRVVNDFLDFAREKPMELARVDPAEEAQELAMFLGADLEKKKLELKLELGQDLPRVDWDRERMRRALLNLLRNAVQASPEGGRVILRMTEEGGALLVDISDDGPGIPAEKAARIFEPFYTTKQKGTGLGLALVKKIVEGHGGSIQLDTEEGKGTRFRIRLNRPSKTHEQEA